MHLSGLTLFLLAAAAVIECRSIENNAAVRDLSSSESLVARSYISPSHLQQRQPRKPCHCKAKKSHKRNDDDKDPELVKAQERHATIVEMDSSNALVWQAGKDNELFTYGLCGCASVAVGSVKAGVLAHYNDEENEGPKDLNKRLTENKAGFRNSKKKLLGSTKVYIVAAEFVDHDGEPDFHDEMREVITEAFQSLKSIVLVQYDDNRKGGNTISLVHSGGDSEEPKLLLNGKVATHYGILMPGQGQHWMELVKSDGKQH